MSDEKITWTKQQIILRHNYKPEKPQQPLERDKNYGGWVKKKNNASGQFLEIWNTWKMASP